MSTLRALAWALLFAIPNEMDILRAQRVGLDDTGGLEVSSVKPNRSGDPRMRHAVPGGRRFTATNVTLPYVVQLAYKLKDFQVVGGPSWINSDRFDIDATTSGASGANNDIEPVRPMLRLLLADRFGFRAHSEARTMSVYSLSLARKDGRLGPGLRPSKNDCSKPRMPEGGAQPPSTLTDPKIDCGFVRGGGVLAGAGTEMRVLASLLSDALGRAVYDETGLAGTYDFLLHYDADTVSVRPGQQPTATPDADQQSLFGALEEQLGLALHSGKAPVEVLVIDTAERPDPN